VVKQVLSGSLAVAHDIVNDVRDAISSLDESSIKKTVALLRDAKKSNRKVFVMGEGPSGLVARALAMRLAELSYNVFVIGETITSAVEQGDLFIAITGSGKTPLVLEAAKIAKEKAGAKIVAITASENSPISEVTDSLVVIKTKSTESDDEDSYLSKQLTGSYISPKRTVFELAASCILEAIVCELSSRGSK
jgi:6-phospho-3-hexuloisomerase